MMAHATADSSKLTDKFGNGRDEVALGVSWRKNLEDGFGKGSFE